MLVPNEGAACSIPTCNNLGAADAVVSDIAAGLNTDFKFAQGDAVVAAVNASPPACVAALCIASCVAACPIVPASVAAVVARSPAAEAPAAPAAPCNAEPIP